MELGSIVDRRYRLIEVLGRGGMGVVYRAEHIQLRRPCALKIILPEHAKDAGIRRRFRREARAVSQVVSEHVVQIFDIGRCSSGEPYMAMELVDGVDLETLLFRHGRLPWERARDIMLQLCAAMTDAHKRGVVHRDLKPSNCIITPARSAGARELVKVVDFGIARIVTVAGQRLTPLTIAGSPLGTPEYMSYEQVVGVRADARADIWALGVILFEIVAGVVPFVGANHFQILESIRADPLPTLSSRVDPSLFPPGLEAILERALTRDRARRYSSADELASALMALGPASAKVNERADDEATLIWGGNTVERLKMLQFRAALAERTPRGQTKVWRPVSAAPAHRSLRERDALTARLREFLRACVVTVLRTMTRFLERLDDRRPRTPRSTPAP